MGVRQQILGGSEERARDRWRQGDDGDAAHVAYLLMHARSAVSRQHAEHAQWAEGPAELASISTSLPKKKKFPPYWQV